MSESRGTPLVWEWVKLGDICDTTSGGTPSRKESKYYGGSIHWVKSGELEHNIIIDTEEKITEEALKNSSAKIFPKGTMLIALYGATIGKLAFLGVAAATNQAVCGIYENKYINSKFLFNYLFFKRQGLVQKSIGGAQPNISQSILKDLQIPFPPLREQLRIVAKMEELFSELDKGVEALKTAQQQLKVYRQAILKGAFEGKLTEEWRKEQINLPTASQLLEQIKTEREKQAKVSGKRLKPIVPLTEEELAELPTLPVGWCWVKNEEYLFEVKDGTHDTPKYIERGIPFITQKNIREKGLDFSDIEYISEENHNKFYQRSDVTKGDIIISMIGHNRGMSAIVETDKVFSIKNVGLFKFFSNLQLNEFNFYYYQSRIGLNIILSKSKGGAQQFIGLTELRNWPVPVCTLNEQHAIVAEIETRLSVADKLEETINQSLQQAEALRQSILKKAFAGKLVPQDPNDEPASKLLERIKAERASQAPVKRAQ